MANKLLSVVKSIPPRRSKSWLDNMLPGTLKDLTELRDKHKAGELERTVADIWKAIRKEVNGLPSIDTFRRWMNGE